MGANCEMCSDADIPDATLSFINISRRGRRSIRQTSPHSQDSIGHSDEPDDISISATPSVDEVQCLPPSSSETQQEEHNADGIDRYNTKRVNTIASEILRDSNDHYADIGNRFNTTRLNQISTDIFSEMCDSIQEEQGQLLSLNAWLERKQYSMPYGWLKRWVVLKDGHILWSEWQQTVENEVDRDEINRWNRCIYLGDGDIVISKTESKKKRKFKINSKDREFVFKTKDKEQRDIWIHGLKQHMQYAQQNAFFINDD